MQDLELLLLCILIIMFIQAGVANSYPFKKWIVVLPIAYMFLGIVISNLLLGVEKSKVIVVGSVLTLLLFLYSMKLNYSRVYWSHSDWGGYYENLNWFYVVSIFLILTAFMFAVFYFIKTGKTKLIRGSLAIASGLFIMLSCNTFLINKEYKVKNALVEYGELIKEGCLVEGFSHAFSFYTKAVPLFSPYNSGLSIEAKEQLITQTSAAYRRHGENNAYVIHKETHSSSEKYKVGDELILNGRSFSVLRSSEISHYRMYLLKYIPQASKE